MTPPKIFDAHHHLWALDHCRYPWLMARGVKRFFGDPAPIQKDYLLRNFLEDASEYELVGSTHIQVGVEEDDALRETQWLQSLADTAPGLPNAIVAFADLRRTDLDQHLALHRQSTHFRGIRQIIGRHPSEDKHSQSGALLKDPRFLRGLQRLEKQDLSFDLQLVASQYGEAVELLTRAPHLRVAICHFASPWDRSTNGFNVWRDAMRKFALLPNVYMKFSGFGMFKPNWTPEDIKPYVDCALELFGPERCMAGSNFPVDKLYGGYDRIWSALAELISDPHGIENVTFQTAIRFYRVDLPVSSSNAERSMRAPSSMNE